MAGEMNSQRLFDLQEAQKLFKIKYEKLSENVYNSANVLLGRVKKSYDFVGQKIQITIPSSFSGGVGSGSLPKANVAIYERAELEAKKMYAVVEIDRETIKASLKDEGSFVRATKEVVQKAVESFMRNMSRALFSDGTGILGKIEAINGNVLTITEATFKEANFEERDLVNALDVNSGDYSLSTVIGGSTPETQEITAVEPETRKVTLSGTHTGLAVGDELIMQGSHKNDPEGLKGVLQTETELTAAGKSPYGISPARRWSAGHVEAASQAAVSTDMLNKAMLNIKKKCGKSPNLIVCSFKQYEKILNLLEDKKRYQVNTRAGLKSKSGADISFSGVEFMSVDGPIGIFPERFVEDDRIYLLNDSHIEIKHRPDFGWFDDDGTVFLRKPSDDAYEARYGGYLQVYINPCFHGVIKDLSV
tara:strand:+ start:1354 stop:2610 length:1257 start_codon:yes stop_codon:yes gene_type:complete